MVFKNNVKRVNLNAYHVKMEMSVFKLKYVISNASHVESQKTTAQNAMVLIDNLYPLVYA